MCAWRSGRGRFVWASIALGVVGVAVLAMIPTFGTGKRRHGDGVCSYEVVSSAPIWMWIVGLVSLVLANAALVYARGIRGLDTQANRIIAWILGIALLVAVVWFVWAQFGYHQVVCEY